MPDADTAAGSAGQSDPYARFMLLEVTPSTTPATYRSALWHHDRCGARLKAYVLLSDVNATSHPLRIARGSHRTNRTRAALCPFA